jgi:hypothetical protein
MKTYISCDFLYYLVQSIMGATDRRREGSLDEFTGKCRILKPILYPLPYAYTDYAFKECQITQVALAMLVN